MSRLVAPGELGVVNIGTLRTEAGAIIPDARIAYRRWGKLHGLDSGRTNIILVEHSLTSGPDADEWWPGLIGPGLALDTNKYCVVCTNSIGGCHGSTGPSSPHPEGGYWGSRFPGISIRDQVTAEIAFLDALGIEGVHAVIGGSMGGARALEWAAMYPERLSAAAIIAVSARASAWQIGIQAAQIDAIEGDPHWHGGNYYGTGQQPREGLATARRIAHLTYRGELELDERFGVEAQEGENPLGPVRDPQQRFAIESYLDYQARKLTSRFDAGSYVTLTDALNRHNIGRGRGGLNRALATIQVPCFVVGVDTDILYPYHQQEHLSRNLGNVLGMARISSPVGHDAFLAEFRQMNRIIRRFITLASAAALPEPGSHFS
ncbi:homoserine O-acetyltransferase [Corynebacterium sp. 3HC-13]|uniref:homoserine O-acetyltransferase MetX n=1 Tax=Corynebacterium poyangense TaxID=2684405 RepID=UPI001CCC1086|nr:homoserine O-acetyltransferase [Corynebacterium poyangense]MBZ8176807.1 homoserine O-acetyltransferase [Corynebacterium poyangense]